MASAHYDPNQIHECSTCRRHYAIRPVEGMNHWHFYHVYCSNFCSMPPDRKSEWGYRVDGADTIFRYLEAQARGIYRQLLQQMHNHGSIIAPPYWYGWHYKDAHPYRFASEFMDRTERAAFFSASERKRYAESLFNLTNELYYGAHQ